MRSLRLPVLIASLTLLASCPSEPTQGSESSGTPSGAQGTPSVIDDVDVQSPEEALQEATDSIDESNVLDELESLEQEIEDN